MQFIPPPSVSEPQLLLETKIVCGTFDGKSDLLGGNCVHYTATCSNGLASDALPQACRGAEEKLFCTLHPDGVKDCCCVTYDKF